jgi:hypothetical protein
MMNEGTLLQFIDHRSSFTRISSRHSLAARIPMPRNAASKPSKPSSRVRTKRPASSKRREVTAAERAQLSGALHMGCTLRTACRYVGVPISAVHEALQRDESFHDELLAAEARCEVTQLKALFTVAGDPKHYRVAMWLLERRFPSRYMPRPPRTFTPEQLKPTLRAMAEAMLEGIDAEMHDKLLVRLDDVLHDLRIGLKLPKDDDDA